MSGSLQIAAVAALTALAGCSVAPLRDATNATAARIEASSAVKAEWPPSGDSAGAEPEFAEPLTLAVALETAFARNPEIRREYAQLGIAHGDLRDAARISNPTLSLAWLSPSGGGPDQTTQGITASFADLLLLPAKRRLSAAEFRRVELAVGGALVTLARDVEAAWYAEVGAQQIAAMRAAVADASAQEGELAKRYFDAGNITRLQLDRQVAAAARAHVDALRARSDAAESRARLANLLGLKEASAWRTVEHLDAPPSEALSADSLTEGALAGRLDLASAKEQVALLEDALKVTSHWRLLGSLEAGYERERELDGTKISGPTLALELPIFNQGQGAVARAEARLLDAHASADGLALSVRNDVSAGVKRLALARDVTERYRTEWLPAADSAVQRQQEQFNYMLVGAFELIQAKRDQYDAWQGYFESLRDYWMARSELRAATGGLLPGDAEATTPAPAPADVAPTAVDAPVPPPENHGDHQP